MKVLGIFQAFLRWKGKVCKQLFCVTDCDRSPNLLSRDACYTLAVLKPCYTVENSTNSTDSTVSPVRHSCASNKGDVVADSFLHQKMKESEKKMSNCSNKWSINKSQLQGDPLTKQDILDVCSGDVETMRSFLGLVNYFKRFSPHLAELSKPLRDLQAGHGI